MTRATVRRLALPLAALALSAASAASALAASEPYDINVILPLTGLASFLGKEEKQALDVLEAYVNRTGGIQGRPLHLAYYDDQSTPQLSVQLMKQAMAGKPPVILGSSLVADCNAMLPLASEGPVVYCFSPGIHPQAGSFGFTTSVSTHDLQLALLRYFVAKGWTRIALITSTDATGQDAERGINEAVALPENKSITVVERAHFNPTDVSVSAQIERIKGERPQALIAWSTGTPIATVFKAIAQSGLDIPVATTNGNQTYAQMERYASFLPKQLYIPTSEWPTPPKGAALEAKVAEAHRVFFAEFKAANARPDVAASLAWDPAMIVVAGLRKLGTETSAAQLKDLIEHLKGYGGVSGLYDFEKVPQRGLDVASAVVTRWDPAAQEFAVVSKPGGAPLAP